MSISFKLNKTISLLIKLYLLGIFVFSSFRMILFLTELDRVDLESMGLGTIMQAFLMGLRFDIVISGYILFFPALILFIIDFFKLEVKWLRRVLFYFIYCLFVIAFIICAADIPYFNQFFDRFSIGAFEWIENTSFVVGMILSEPLYFIISIPCIVLSILFFIGMKRSFNNYHTGQYKNVILNIVIALLCLGLMFLGVRGRIAQKSPIRVGTAYFSQYAFLNKLGLNPVFTLMRSYLDSQDKRNEKVQLIPADEAIENFQKFFAITPSQYSSPIARKRTYTKNAKIKNVVLVIMESMSAAKMSRHGNPNKLTPFLDSLAQESIYFENYYTAGKHTFNGIFSTLYSFPALYRQHPMKKISEYDGIATTLKANGYSTTYMTTHDGQFDNVEGFLIANGFEQVISQKNYPSSEVKTTLGVPDDYMFRFAIPEINKLAGQDKPFFISLMTASDHGPYYIPEYFQPHSEDIKEQIVEYADWSIQQFMKLAQKQDWFNETLFVFTADHGVPMGNSYDISLNYFHSPLIFYAADSSINDQKKYSKIASQLDVYPSIMASLGIDYVNNSMGIDLFHEDRKYTLLNDDDKIGIIDSLHFAIMKADNPTTLYDYGELSRIDLSDSLSTKKQEMETFAKSVMQLHQHMIDKHTTSLSKQ